MDIKILGGGCQKCDKLKKITEEAAQELNLDYQIEKVSDMVKIMEYSVMTTPALVVDGIVKHSGSVPSKDVIMQYLKDA